HGVGGELSLGAAVAEQVDHEFPLVLTERLCRACGGDVQGRTAPPFDRLRMRGWAARRSPLILSLSKPAHPEPVEGRMCAAEAKGGAATAPLVPQASFLAALAAGFLAGAFFAAAGLSP